MANQVKRSHCKLPKSALILVALLVSMLPAAGVRGQVPGERPPANILKLAQPALDEGRRALEAADHQGGFGNGFLGRNGITKFRSVDHTIQNWVKANGCNTEPEIMPLPDNAADGMKVTRKTWGGGKAGSEVVLIEIEGGGHTWPGQKPIVSLLGESIMDISANDVMWEFFQKHTRKPGNAATQGTKK